MSHRPAVRAVLFDLDGVLVSTDEWHYRAWSEIARREGIPFTRAHNERLRGVSRMESLAILLERASRRYSDSEKQALAEAKNARYVADLATLTPADLLPGARALLDAVRAAGLRAAIASSSRNARTIVQQVGIAECFDAVVDGNDIVRSKPDPEVFLLAAERCGVSPQACVVVEDAAAGVEAGLRAGCRVIGIGSPAALPHASHVVPDLAALGLGLLRGDPR